MGRQGGREVAVMLLTELVDRYAAKRLRGTSPHTAYLHRKSVADFSSWLGRPAAVGDLADDVIESWAWWLVESRGLAATTANGQTKKILALWSFAARHGLVDRWPETRKLREPRRIPSAWSREQLQRLFSVLNEQRGRIAGVLAADWWASLHWIAWDSGERINAILSIRWDDVDLIDRWLVCRAETRKGKRSDRIYRIGEDTVAALAIIRWPDRELVLPWDRDRSLLWVRYTQILKSAGLPHDRTRKFHCLRRSVASHLAAAGGDATAALDHSSPEVTKRSYLDPRIVQAPQPVDLLFRPGQ